MKRKLRNLIGAVSLLVSALTFAQPNLTFSSEPSPWRTGGGIGLSLGSGNYFGVSVSPFLGYAFTQQLEAGVSVGYQYSSWKNAKKHLLNMGPYLNYYPISNLFTRVQYEYYTGNTKSKQTGNKTGFDENALWIGAGYRTPGPVSFYMGILYDVLYKSDSSLFSNGFRPMVGVSIGI